MPASHKPVTNPLTIIAIFAGIIEASSLASLPFLEGQSQDVYTWFLVGFPPFLTLLFFITLNFNHKTLYSPSDFNDPQDFLNAAQPFAVAPAALAQPALAKPPRSRAQPSLAMTHLRLFERDVHLIELRPGFGEQPAEVLLGQLLETLGNTDLSGAWVVLACAGTLPLKARQDLRCMLQGQPQARDAQVMLLDIEALRLAPVGV